MEEGRVRKSRRGKGRILKGEKGAGGNGEKKTRAGSFLVQRGEKFGVSTVVDAGRKDVHGGKKDLRREGGSTHLRS